MIKIGKDISKFSAYSYRPENKEELEKIIKERIKKEGNNCDLNDIDVSQINDMISSRTRKKRRVQDMSVKSAHQEESADVATPEMLGLSIMKKTRKTKEISGAFERGLDILHPVGRQGGHNQMERTKWSVGRKRTG